MNRFQTAWLTSLSCSLAVLSYGTSAAITKQPYLLVEEISISQTDSLEDATYEFYPTAAVTDSTDVTYVSGSAQAVLSPFRFFEFSAPLTFDYGCQYSDEVCELLLYGTEDSNGDSNEDGFTDYREALEDQDDDNYSSYFLTFLATGSSDTPSAGTVTSWSEVTDKFYVFDTSALNDTDTRILDLYVDSSDNIWAVGYDSDPFTETDTTDPDSERETLSRAFIQRAFLKNTATDTVISLLPTIFSEDDDDDDSDATDLTDDYGGLSAAYKIVEIETDDGTAIYAIGQASNGFIDDDPDYWEDCQYDADYYTYCSGYTTQAWAWDITDIVNGDDTTTEELEGFALADDWVDTNSDSDYDVVNRSAIAYAMKSDGVGVGYSTIDISESVTGGHAQAVTFICEDSDEDNEYEDGECSVTKIPNTADEDDYDDSEIDHQWATDINDNGYIIGNSRSAQADNRNKAVEFFIFEAVTDSETGDYDFTDSDGTLSWPLRDKPIDGANSEIKAMNENNLAVGWRDAEDEEQPSYGGTTRQQAAFLFDIDRYMGDDEDADDDADYVWYLNDLICYEEDGEAAMPDYYLIEYATEILDDDSIIASGYKYASLDDMENSSDPTPVLLRLSVNDSGDIDDLASCPEVEEESYDRQGGASITLLWLLLPFAYLRRRKPLTH